MIKIHGKYIRNIPEQVGKNKRDIFQLDSDLSALEVKVNEALAGVFHYKGSVATYADLPSSDNEVGDVYNVLDTGKNYAWDGSAWDDLGGLVDLSNYYTKAEADAEFVDVDSTQTIPGEKTFSNGLKCGTVDLSSPNNGFQVSFNNTSLINIYTYGTYIRSNVIPIAINLDLGSSAYPWKDLYLAGEIKFADGVSKIYNSSNKLYLFGNSGITISNNAGSKLEVAYGINPTVNGTEDLGSPSYTWKDIYLSGVIHLGAANQISVDQYNQIVYGVAAGYPHLFYGTIQPRYDNSYSLGNTAVRWKNVFVAENLSDGTNTATVADISALIAYAKAQGWIS